MWGQTALVHRRASVKTRIGRARATHPDSELIFHRDFPILGPEHAARADG